MVAKKEAPKETKNANTAKAVKPVKAAKPSKAGKGKAAKNAKSAKSKAEKPKKVHHFKKINTPLFEKRTKVFAVGRNVNTHRDLTRYVKWPKYIQRQRQRRVLYTRLKVPPAINQFSNTLDKNTAIQAFKLLVKYRPENKKERRARLILRAKAIVQRRKALAVFRKSVNKHIKETRSKNREAKKGTKKVATEKTSRKKMDKKSFKLKPKNLPSIPSKRTHRFAVKYGINHITSLVESKKAKVVFIANDVDPIELVVWLPTLCRKMQVPFCIVKNKARLGKLVGKKTATAVALTDVEPQHKDVLANLLEAIKKNYTEKYEENRRQWGGGVMGLKSRHAAEKKAKAIAAEKAKARATS